MKKIMKRLLVLSSIAVVTVISADNTYNATLNASIVKGITNNMYIANNDKVDTYIIKNSNIIKDYKNLCTLDINDKIILLYNKNDSKIFEVSNCKTKPTIIINEMTKLKTFKDKNLKYIQPDFNTFNENSKYITFLYNINDIVLTKDTINKLKEKVSNEVCSKKEIRDVLSEGYKIQYIYLGNKESTNENKGVSVIIDSCEQ